MDGAQLFPSEQGTPQGGVISTLLANVALHGLETDVTEKFARSINGRRIEPRVIRFADDFVVIDEDEAVIKEAKEYIAEWLEKLGLELKPSKTRITHTLREYEGNVGFDFLGFHIQQTREACKVFFRSCIGRIHVEGILTFFPTKICRCEAFFFAEAAP